MIRDQRETALPTTGGEEGVTGDQLTTSLRQWSGQKDPRIVRVSRTFGGKDRHSKVRTIRGLRDRRVRLSVPTAIQLYDLQDRLGLNQPSKVVDWLLDAAQHEINKLPPLQLPPQSFNFPQLMAPPQAPLRPLSLFSNDENFGNQDAVSDLEFLQRYPLSWNSDALQRSKQKVVMREGNVINDHKEVGIHSEQFAAHQYPASLISNGLSYASYYPSEQSNARGIHSSELEVPHCSTSQLLLLAPRSQLAFYHADGTPSISPPYMATSSSFGMKELSHFPIGSFDSQHHSVELHHEKSP